MSEFGKRTLTGAVFIIVTLGAVLGGEWTFFSLLFLVNILGLREFLTMLKTREQTPAYISVITAGAAVYLVGSLYFMDVIASWHLFLLPPLALMGFVIELFRRNSSGFRGAALGVAAIVYISIPLSLFVSMAYVSGAYSYIMPLAYFLLLWSSDTFAYLTGKAFGRTQLFPVISPKKTWEGTLGGLLCTMGVAIALYYTVGTLSIGGWIGLAAVIVVAGSIGDLVESMLKRNLEIKDSGSILPGHGGVLDRFDSLLFSLPFSAAYLHLCNNL